MAGTLRSTVVPARNRDGVREGTATRNTSSVICFLDYFYTALHRCRCTVPRRIPKLCAVHGGTSETRTRSLQKHTLPSRKLLTFTPACFHPSASRSCTNSTKFMAAILRSSLKNGSAHVKGSWPYLPLCRGSRSPRPRKHGLRLGIDTAVRIRNSAPDEYRCDFATGPVGSLSARANSSTAVRTDAFLGRHPLVKLGQRTGLRYHPKPRSPSRSTARA